MESLNESKAAAARANEESIELRALEREARAQRELLESFLGRYREAVARTDSGYLPPDARIISRADAPLNPSFPKKKLMSVVAALAALMLSAALIVVREFTSGRAFRIIGAGSEPVPAAKAPAVRREPEIDPAFVSAPQLPNTGALPQDAPGIVELADALADDGVRVALFAGVHGGEGAGDIALASARLASARGPGPVILDIGMTPSEALGGGAAPGLGELLSGNAAFGEVIRHDEQSQAHFIAMGSAEEDPPLQRLSLVIGALVHSYDKVVIVADSLADWPAEHVRPDVAAIVCGPELDEAERRAAYDRALEQGARSALVVRRMGGSGSTDAQRAEEPEQSGAAA